LATKAGNRRAPELPSGGAARMGILDDAKAVRDNLQAQQALLTDGTPGTATITNLTDTGMLVNFNPQIVLDLQVAIEGQDPYAVQLTTQVPVENLPRLQAGGQVGVRVDPADPTTVALDWTTG
jgi:hypothetical protein